MITKTIVHVMGARPNYMKIAPLMTALKDRRGIRQRSASHAVQTARMMMKFEEICVDDKPDLVSVVGDINSTMAAALVAAKLLIPVAHVEAGPAQFRPHDA